MKLEFKIFDFFGIPVYFRLWFLLLFTFLSPIQVLILFIAVLVHEMGHAYVAKKLGYGVDHIAIDLFFGSAAVDMQNIHEKDSLKIVAAGPLSNILLCLVSFLIVPLSPEFAITFFTINLLLFIFNIIPIYPLDGGRMFKDILILKLKNRYLANKIASWVSLVCSLGLVIFALVRGDFILAIFSLLFAYYALKELGYIK